jgi:hypothetical protein
VVHASPTRVERLLIRVDTAPAITLSPSGS